LFGFEWGDLANRATVIGLPPAIIGLICTLVGVILAIRQLKLGRRATTASILVSLHESFRQAWLEFRGAEDPKLRMQAFGDITNLVELGCAVFHDGLLEGHTGEILETYLCHILAMIQASEEGPQWMQELLHTTKTFKNTLDFLRSHKNQISLEAVFPDAARAQH
jgi:hypothetical protein